MKLLFIKFELLIRTIPIELFELDGGGGNVAALLNC